MMKGWLVALLCVCSLGMGIGGALLAAKREPLKELPGSRYQVQGQTVMEWNGINGDRCVQTGKAMTCDWRSHE